MAAPSIYKALGLIPITTKTNEIKLSGQEVYLCQLNKYVHYYTPESFVLILIV